MKNINKAKYIYIPRQNILLDRETAYISTIYAGEKEDRKVEIEKTKTNCFGVKSKYKKEITRCDTKYYFRLGDSSNSIEWSHFDKDILAKKWKFYANKIARC